MSSTPNAYIVTRNSKPTNAMVEVAGLIQGYDVGACIGPVGAIDLSSGLMLAPEQVMYRTAQHRNDSMDAMRMVIRPSSEFRSRERDVPWLNPDSAFALTVDKLRMADVLGDLTIPTRLLLKKNQAPDEVMRILHDAGQQWGKVVVKPRSGQLSEGVAVGDARELAPMISQIAANPESKNLLVQPYLETRGVEKPGLPPQLGSCPASLRVLASRVSLPDGFEKTKILTAYYRYSSVGSDLYHGGEHDDRYFFLQMDDTPVHDQYPDLSPCFDVAEAALKRCGAYISKHTTATHGIQTQFCSIDMLLLPEDSQIGYASENTHAPYRPIVMELNSATERISAEESAPTRAAWHSGEAALVASLALGTYIDNEAKR